MVGKVKASADTISVNRMRALWCLGDMLCSRGQRGGPRNLEVDFPSSAVLVSVRNLTSVGSDAACADHVMFRAPQQLSLD